MTSCPQLMLVSGAVPVHMQDFALPLVRYHEVLSAQSSALTRSLWEAAQPSRVLFLPVTKAGNCILKSCQILNLRELKAPEMASSTLHNTLLWLALKTIIVTQYVRRAFGMPDYMQRLDICPFSGKR